jgi:L-iditol 2-dehydrogenase
VVAPLTAEGMMCALVKTADGPGNVALRDVQVPHARAGEVRVAVIATGICGTDLHIVDGEWRTVPPVIMGHEVSGVIDEVGAGVGPHWLGQRVALETYASTCGTCDYCRGGQPNLCSGRRSIGSHVDGGFASYLAVPLHNAHAVHESVGPVAGALYEPLACVAHALCDPAVSSPGDTALVVGPGAIGLLAAQVLRGQGAAVSVVGLKSDATRLEVASTLGLLVLEHEELEVRTPEGGFRVVVECSGTEGGIRSALEAARKGGTLVQIGLAGHPVQVELDTICLKQLIVRSANASTPRSWARTETLVASGTVMLDPLVSDVLPIALWEDAFTRTRGGRGVKLLLHP